MAKRDSTPTNKSAANIRHRLELFGEALDSERLSEDEHAGLQKLLRNTVHRNFEEVSAEVITALNSQGGSHLSREVFQSAARGAVSMAVAVTLARVGELLRHCESPAEELFALALDTVLTAKKVRVQYLVESPLHFDDEFTLTDAAEELEGDFDTVVTVEPQGAIYPSEDVDYESDPFRADFLLTCYRRTGIPKTPITQYRLAVEIDGRHHATDVRRSRDNERDRVFRSQGIIPDRYTGVDILKDPFSCADRVVEQLLTS